ncbi:MAG: hypothetical protein M0P31_12050 [Solirubrobacteraceae bacterium]|nr:hypothetical protein [Solirubrobacteraceae bacterium]
MPTLTARGRATLVVTLVTIVAATLTALVPARALADPADDLRGLLRAADALTDGSDDAGRWAAVVRGLDRAVTTVDARRRELDATLAGAPGALRAADRATRRLDRSLDVLRAGARSGAPVAREVAATARAAVPWTAALRRTVAAAPAWSRAARGALPAVTGLLDDAGGVAGPGGRVGRCIDRVLVPAARRTVEDGAFTTGRPLYRSAGYAIVGIAGALQDRDAGGPWGRLDLGVGRDALEYASVGAGTAVGAVDRVPVGIRPAPPARWPAYRDDRRCAAQPVPDPDRARSIPGDAEAAVGRAQSEAARDRAAGDGVADARGLAAGADRTLRRLLERLDPLGTAGEDDR